MWQGASHNRYEIGVGLADINALKALSARKVMVGVGVLVCVIGAIWGAATIFQSPEQRAANAKPPEPKPIVVPVVRADLRDDYTVNARIAANTNHTYALPAIEGERMVVTRAIRKAGDVIEDGEPIIEINDRPLITLFGYVPMYRTIKAGMKGGDVQRLQLALAKLGYNVEADGAFGPHTQRAVRAHYKKIGEQPPLCPVEPGDLPTPKNDAEAAKPQPTGILCIRLADVIFISFERPTVISLPNQGDILSGDGAKLVLTDGSSGLAATIPEKEATRITEGANATALYKGKIEPLTVVGKEEIKQKEGQNNANVSTIEGFKNFTVTFSAQNPGVFNDLGANEVPITIPRTPPIIGQFVVPERAIMMNGAGQSVLQVQAGEAFNEVKVENLGCVGGQCAVKAAGNALKEGVLVRVRDAEGIQTSEDAAAASESAGSEGS